MGKHVQEDQLLQPVTDATKYPTVIHGTYAAAWPSIQKQGLSRMKRQHIHFATGLPASGGVISGMRRSCDLVIHLDLAKALRDGIPMFVSSNGVILSPGIDGFIAPKYFAKVEPRR